MRNRIVNSVVEERVKVRPRASSEDEFFFFSSDTPPIELPGIFRIVVLPFVRSLWLYIFFCSLHLGRPFVDYVGRHLSVCPTYCELQWATRHCLGVIPSLMRPDCQLRAFNAKVTGSSTIVLSPCSHSCPSTLVPLFGDDGEGCGGWRIVLSFQDTSCQGHDVPRRFLLVAVGLP